MFSNINTKYCVNNYAYIKFVGTVHFYVSTSAVCSRDLRKK